MEALPRNLCVSPSMVSAIFFSQMVEPDRSNAVTNDHADWLEPVVYEAHPLGPAQAASKSSKPRLASTKPTRRPRLEQPKLSVLVVDDVADVTEMIALLLKHAGYDVSTAHSATAAMRLAYERAFDLVISDIGMPEMNGYELAESLRTLSDYRRIPIIAVTGYSEYDDRERALRAGFNAHLTKPIDPSRLLDLMNELLR